MKKLLGLLCLMMWLPIISFSQTTSTDTCITITTQQLKNANLIFAEHQAYKQELGAVSEQFFNDEQIIENMLTMDSIKNDQLDLYNSMLANSEQNAVNLQKIVKIQQYVSGGSLVVTIILAIICLIK